MADSKLKDFFKYWKSAPTKYTLEELEKKKSLQQFSGPQASYFAV